MAIEDPHWPRAAAWLASESPEPRLVVVGVPSSRGSLSPSRADTTPAAVRRTLARFSRFDGEHRTDLAELAVDDLGDWPVSALDPAAAVEDIAWRAGRLPAAAVYAFFGGDNLITRPLVRGLSNGGLATTGVLTFDAHHDVRVYGSRPTNGSPIHGLIDDGLPGENVTQIGIHTFANSAEYREWCDDHDVNVITMAEVDATGIEEVTADALDDLADRCDRIYVDVDMDVLDRSFAPACPGSRPGGLDPRGLAAAVYRCGCHPSVVAADFVEVDAAADRDEITVMNLALAFLSFASGVASRGEADSVTAKP